MIKAYKTLYNKYDIIACPQKERKLEDRTRGHELILMKKHCHYYEKKHCFSNREVNLWNSLPSSVVMARTANTFKKDWTNFGKIKRLKFNFKAEIIGIMNRRGTLRMILS